MASYQPVRSIASDAWRDPPLAEVRANILSQKIGAATIADFNLPDEFVRRVAEHIYREAFQRQFRAVMTPPVPPPASSPATQPVELAGDGWLRFPETPPPLRGFRAAVTPGSAFAPFDLDAGTPEPVRAAADQIAKGLAKDGLLAATAAALTTLEPLAAGNPETQLRLLAEAGVPVDLLPCFDTQANSSADRWQESARRVITALHSLNRSGMPADARAARLRSWTFSFRRSDPLFTCAAESGVLPLQGLRIQCTRGDNWTGAGGGDSVDLALHLLAAAPDARATLAVQDCFAGVLAGDGRWLDATERTTLLPQSLPVAQWAQDNAKAGFVRFNGRPAPATLLPRYASRSEERSVFVAGEHLAAVATKDHWPLVCSSLLFQGGNLLAVEQPNGQRVLLVGEAEIHRNMALGLSGAEAEAAFAAEFDAAKVVVLPAASFHIDLEVTCRTTEREVLAFVNDQDAGARLIVHAGLDACTRANILRSSHIASLRKMLDASDCSEFLATLLPIVQSHQVQPGVYDASLAQHFSAGPADRAAPNLRRFLIALDYLLATSDLASQLDSDIYTASYLRSMQRTRADRAALRRELERLGWRVIPTPSFEETGAAVNAVNGIHDRARYFMPVHNGLYANLDRAAEAVFRKALPPNVKIVPIPTNETQTRAGALHCAVSTYYAAN